MVDYSLGKKVLVPYTDIFIAYATVTNMHIEVMNYERLFILVANMTEQTTSTIYVITWCSTNFLYKITSTINLNGPEKVYAVIADPLLETKVDELVTIYRRPEYCQYLVAPKINKIVGQKLKPDGRDARRYPSQQFILSLKLATQASIRSVSFVFSTTSAEPEKAMRVSNFSVLFGSNYLFVELYNYSTAYFVSETAWGNGC